MQILSDEPKVGLLIALGVACFAGAAGIAWFSSVETLQLTRTQGSVTVLAEARLFALVPIRLTRIDNVQSATAATAVPEVSRPRAYTRLLFETPSGPQDLWITQHPFVRRYSDIKAFFDDPAQRHATFSSIADGRETVRFVVAQLSALFLAMCGGGAIYVAVRSILGTDRGIGPIDA